MSNNNDVLALRIAIDGLNSSKHPSVYRDEVFGFEGARVNGESTFSNDIFVKIPDKLSRFLTRDASVIRNKLPELKLLRKELFSSSVHMIRAHRLDENYRRVQLTKQNIQHLSVRTFHSNDNRSRPRTKNSNSKVSSRWKVYDLLQQRYGIWSVLSCQRTQTCHTARCIHPRPST